MKPKISLVGFIALGCLSGLNSSSSDIPFEDIIWIVGQRNESQSQTCNGNRLSPLYMGDYPLEWNSDTLENIVVSVLGKTILPSSTNGISGCCVPGLWCSDDGCFTQGFGSSFSNFGWLSTNFNAKPVYTCYNDTSLSDLGDVSLSSAILSSGYLTVNGAGFGSVPPAITINVDSQYCFDPEICSCPSCSSSNDCSIGQDCIVPSSSRSDGKCLTSCGGPDDTSCPCGYGCSVLATSSSQGTFYACVPSDFFTTSVACNQHDMLICSIPNLYQSLYSPLSSDVVSIALTSSQGSLSASGPSGSNSGFCSTDADCSDGNLCTIDTCSGGLCAYDATDSECGSILPTIRSRYSPFMYLDTLFHNRSELQANFTSFMIDIGTLSTVTSAGLSDYTDTIQLPFSTVFFGNLVSQMGITPYGVVSVEPQQPCNTGSSCPLFTSASNAIALWYSSQWSTVTATGRGIYAYTQTVNDNQTVYGIGSVNAFHVLYANLNNNTFGASLYEDGSIRVSYAEVNSLVEEDFFGLWGSYAYKGPSRYHQETLNDGVITSGVDVVYCPLSALACVPQSCVAAGDTLSVHWNGTDNCTALGPSAQLALTCSWAGGVAFTSATFVPAPNNATLPSVSCVVPSLSFPNGSLLFVDIVVSVTTSESIDTNAASSALPGSNTIYSVTSRGQELSRSNLQIRYYSSHTNESGYAECGCSALSGGNVNQTCDLSFVCNTDTTSTASATSYLDCAGVPFGAAFEDCEGTCMFGTSGVYSEPAYCGDDDSDSGGGSDFLNIVSQTIILLIIICCMTFVTSTISYSVRRMLIRRRLEEQQDFEFEADLYVIRNGGGGVGGAGANRRGLSEFECDALGTIVFTQEFYREHKKKQLELMHGIAATPAPAAAGEGASGPTANGMGGCDCPICLMDIMEGNVVRALPDPCGHVFHVACIDQWFKQSHVCPLCKRSMRAILEGEEESTSDSDLNPTGNTTTRYPSRTHQHPSSGDNSRSLAALDRIISRINGLTASSSAGGSATTNSNNRGGNNNNSDPEAGIALTRYPSGGNSGSEETRGESSTGPVAERGSRHFEL